MSENILTVSDLVTLYKAETKTVKAIRNLDLGVRRGETIALVGESGSGKSTLGLSILRLIEAPNEISNGKMIFHDTDGDISILDLSLPEIRKFRWKKVSMVFQSAMNVLNPIMRIEDQFIETFDAHNIGGDHSERINHYLDLAGLGPKVRRLYPHELSGGMKQRVCIALALSCEPEMLIADEPTTALDVVVQKEVLLELNNLKNNLNLSIIFITHDLRVAATVADRIGIFYAGRLVELGPKDRVIANPRHPYSKLLLSSIITTSTPRGQKLATLSGSPPDLSQTISGCSFYDRCPVRLDACRSYDLDRVTIENDHFAECIRAKEDLDVVKAALNKKELN